MNIPVYCSTGTFLGRYNGRDWRILSELAAQIDADGFELMVFSNWYGELDELARTLKKSGLYFGSLHTEKGIGSDLSEEDPEKRKDALIRLEQNCALAEKLGIQIAVLHLWGAPNSDLYIGRNIELFAECKKIAEQYGVTLAVENIVCAEGDPLDVWRELVRVYPDIRLTFDSRMCAFHKEFDASYVLPYWEDGHIAHVHFADFSGGFKEFDAIRKILHPGEGEVDVSRLAMQLKSKRYCGAVTMESPGLRQDGTVDFLKLNNSLRTLKTAFNQIQN
ncbi:MAG TPA: sugar phosphate isomerase/epimerase family protein [Oscillospiraceae bacterium]|nr:sugar phosphate isomerase/epimerase family protein [Oscillospiraceae bacterium]HPS35789.1 sugar phosphate isomerase/epimerase family protein [Oscillospiraceae bacterium]